LLLPCSWWIKDYQYTGSSRWRIHFCGRSRLYALTRWFNSVRVGLSARSRVQPQCAYWLVPFLVHPYWLYHQKANNQVIFPKTTQKNWSVEQSLTSLLHNSHKARYCAPMWHFALTKAQSESLEAIQKRAIHITHNLTRGMPYSSMLYCVNLNSLASRREDLSRDFFHSILDPASCLHSLAPLSTQINGDHLKA